MFNVKYYYNDGSENCEKECNTLSAVRIGGQIQLPQVRSAKVRNQEGLVMLISKLPRAFSESYAVRMLVNSELKDITFCDFESDVENMINIFSQGGYNYNLA